MTAPTCQCGCGRAVSVATSSCKSRSLRAGEPMRFVPGHRAGVANLQSFEVAPDGCWNWTGRLDAWGYGRLGRRGAHRASYIERVGPIPEGLVLDHLCNNPRCINPDHLEPVTDAENHRRKAERQTHCKHGHEFTPENTYIAPSGSRHCRACNRVRVAAYSARKKAEAQS